ncbi:putative membrane protein [Xenorhabdus nematophila ATCC 19061]|uniref:Membrane protein n=1 Tax=Xenorhabdus nematophila (strain ATCC 19061 / DSM 3370 / CCUG 14189 / LMG 1036 / NCIMB 9965 / AN6) TaxID=406817 RepID=D3VJ21_XENNA|nr:hypothetical protein D3790_04745 [Xenorhabdus nematophila]CBJ90878.1 putative membrane protein [Xenorhabdus nematophila ATCC 19061]CEE90303.1 putative membrane protein [Xenorhabdus nematophila str. Anatoliense]CEF28446.1 putative membrane protein [Xenorhabdus nematophila str. Websteri]CEK23712.1 putative membrane protein [Xenorhabdus nematophila AN6/1]
MTLSRYKTKKHDQKILDALNILDNRLFLGFIAITLTIVFIGDKGIAKVIFIIWPVYSLIYIRIFRKLSNQLIEKGMRELVNSWGNLYPFYQCSKICICLSIIGFIIFILSFFH